jgi:hypothetical protein
MNFPKERKMGYADWIAVLMRAARDRSPVRILVETGDKKVVSVLSPEDRKVVRRTVRTSPIRVFLDTQNLAQDSGAQPRAFNHVVRVGDVIDVGEGGTPWDASVRFGVVDEWGVITYLEGGGEEEIMNALLEMSAIVLPVEEENMIKVNQYLHDDPEYDYLFRKVMGIESR